jgi:hypothetical protein
VPRHIYEGRATLVERACRFVTLHAPYQHTWQVSGLLEVGAPGIPCLGVLLQQLSVLLEHELSTHESVKSKDRLLKGDSHLKGAMGHLHCLERVLELEPPPVIVQFTSQPQVVQHSHSLCGCMPASRKLETL